MKINRLRLAAYLAAAAILASAAGANAQDATSGLEPRSDVSVGFDFRPGSPLEFCDDPRARGVCLSVYEECEVPRVRELNARLSFPRRNRGKISPRSRWFVDREECTATFAGSVPPCFTPAKDEILITPGINRVWQAGQEFCRRSEFTIIFLDSQTGFYDLRLAPRIPEELGEYYFQRTGLGGLWTPLQELPYTYSYQSFYEPTVQAFTVPNNWVTEIDGIMYPSGYLITSDHFIAQLALVDLIGARLGLRLLDRNPNPR